MSEQELSHPHVPEGGRLVKRCVIVGAARVNIGVVIEEERGNRHLAVDGGMV